MPNKEKKIAWKDIPVEQSTPEHEKMYKLKRKTHNVTKRMGEEVNRHLIAVKMLESELDDIQKEMFELIGGKY